MSYKNIFCVNCGQKGHILRECVAPITSFGIIAYRIVNCKKTDFEHCGTVKRMLPTINSVYPIVKFLMIQRKDTIGYIDFIRGKYKDEESIKILFEEMTIEERNNLSTKTFDEIWDNLWVNHESKCYRNEYDYAKKCFQKVDIQKFLQITHTNYIHQEFGFPKGRRNIRETNLECAQREFFEETGYPPSTYTVFNKNQYFEEFFKGTNGIYYKHIYYLAQMHDNIYPPVLDPLNITQIGEVKNIGFFSIDECNHLIRPYDNEKKNVINSVYKSITDISYKYLYTNEYLIEIPLNKTL